VQAAVSLERQAPRVSPMEVTSTTPVRIRHVIPTVTRRRARETA
jgi:hypothetical protein